MLIEFGDSLVIPAFAVFDYVVEVLAYYEFDFFLLLLFPDRHDLADGFFPYTVGVDVGVGLDGADDGVGGDASDGGALDYVFEGGADVQGAVFVEVQSASVAVKRGAVAEAEFLDDGAGMAPVDEVVFDFIALGVISDLAFGGVDFGGGDRCFGCYLWIHGIFLFGWPEVSYGENFLLQVPAGGGAVAAWCTHLSCVGLKCGLGLPHFQITVA